MPVHLPPKESGKHDPEDFPARGGPIYLTLQPPLLVHSYAQLLVSLIFPANPLFDPIFFAEISITLLLEFTLLPGSGQLILLLQS